MSDKKAVEVKRIVIRMGDKEVSLSPEEARELTDILSEMFGHTKVTSVVFPVPYYYPTVIYTTPKWEVTYDGKITGGTVYCSNT